MKDIMLLKERRTFIKKLSLASVFGIFGLNRLSSMNNVICIMESDIMKLRPHHILDIVTGHGSGITYEPHPYGHSQHIVAEAILTNLDLKIQLIIGADAICKGCKHLLDDGQCKDVLSQLDPPIPKQKYNDTLDNKVFEYLKIEVGTTSTIQQFLKIVNEKVPGIETICTHPKQDQQERLDNLTKGLIKLGIRES